MTGPSLRLTWPDCRNVRDVGGLPTTDGGTVRVGALVRGDSPHRLTADGIAAVHGYGIRQSDRSPLGRGGGSGARAVCR